MAEPENQTIRLLREMRVALKRLEGKVDQNHTDLTSRMDNLRQAINGESVLGRRRRGRGTP